MNSPLKWNRVWQTPPLTRTRVIVALAIAVIADGLQFLLGPLGWVLIDQAIDVVTMVLVSWVIGFHWLLLPTFAVELIPIADELPTWIACVAAVVALRRHEEKVAPNPPAPPDKPVIDV